MCALTCITSYVAPHIAKYLLGNNVGTILNKSHPDTFSNIPLSYFTDEAKLLSARKQLSAHLQLAWLLLDLCQVQHTQFMKYTCSI